MTLTKQAIRNGEDLVSAGIINMKSIEEARQGNFMMQAKDDTVELGRKENMLPFGLKLSEKGNLNS